MKTWKEFVLITGNRCWIDPATACGVQEKPETINAKAATVVYCQNNQFHLAHPVDEVLAKLAE